MNTLNKAKWNWASKRGSTDKLKSIRVRKTTTKKNPHYSLTIPEKIWSDMGMPTEISVGVSPLGIFISVNPIGTSFRLNNSGKATSYTMYSMELVQSILDIVGLGHQKDAFFDFDVKPTPDDGIFQLLDAKATKYGFQ